MPDVKFSQLNQLFVAAADDYMPIVDNSDDSMGIAGTNKKISVTNLTNAVVTNTSVNAAIGGNLLATKTLLEIPKGNFTATTAPTVNDDFADGYISGSKWYDNVGHEAYICVDSTVGAAVWMLATLTADDLGSAAFTESTDYAPRANPSFTGTVTSSGAITTTGINAGISTSGYDATITTIGDNGYISTIGDTASISTSGASATISTSGNFAHIFTAGSDAVIETQGTNGYIRSRSTFKLFNGTYTTTLSHSPTADRAIAFPNKAGTIALTSDLNALTPITLGLNNTASGTNASAVGYNNTSSANSSSTAGFQNFTVGIPQIETATIVGGCTVAGNLSVTVTSALVTGSPLLVSVPLTTAQNTASLVAAAVITALNSTAAITTHYTVGGTGATYTLTAKVAAANDTTLNMAHAKVAPLTGITDDSSSTSTVAGVAGTNASAFGKGNTSIGDNSSSFGISNTVSAINSVAVGNSNRIKSTGLGSVAFGVLNNVSGATLNETTGIITGTLADTTTHGKLSTAVGVLNTTSGNFSSALGYDNTVTESAQNSTAVGAENTINGGGGSTAIGWSNTINGSGGGTAIGNLNTAEQDGTAVGHSNSADAIRSTAVGHVNNYYGSPGEYSSAFGESNVASGEYSTAIGSSNRAIAINSISIGLNNLSLTTAHASISVGVLNNTSGTRAISPTTGAITGSANNPVSHGRLSTAVGILNVTSGANSTAIGYANTTSGANSSAFGNQVITSVANTQELGVGNGTTRLSSVRVHGTGYVGLSLRDTATALTDGGATVGAEADGTLMRGAYALRRDGSNLFIDANSSAGTVTSNGLVIKLTSSEYTVTNPPAVPLKTFNASGATIDDVYNVLATLIQTLKDRQII